MCVNQKRIHRAFKPFLVEHQRDFPLRWPLLPLRRRVVCSWIVGCRHLKSSNVFLELVWNQRHQESSYVKRLWHIEPSVWRRDFRKAGKLCLCKITVKSWANIAVVRETISPICLIQTHRALTWLSLLRTEYRSLRVQMKSFPAHVLEVTHGTVVDQHVTVRDSSSLPSSPGAAIK